MIGYTLPEIRRLLISLIQACAPDPEAARRRAGLPHRDRPRHRVRAAGAHLGTAYC